MSIPRSLAAGILGSVFASAGLAAPVSLEPAQKAVTEWAKVRSETIRLQSQWEWEREALRSTELALEDRVRALEQKQIALASATAADRKGVADLAQQVASAEASLKAADTRLKAVADEVARLRPWFPPRLSRGLEMAFRSVARPDAPPSERAQHVMTILNRCAQFNKAISQGEEVVALPGGKDEKLLDVVYWGLGVGYALDRGAGKAYLGFPGQAGWEWQERPGLAPAVERLLAVARDQADPQFIEVTARVSDPFASSKGEGRP